MKKITTILILILSLTLIADRGFAQAGLLDNSYGNGGKANSVVANGSVIWAMTTIDGWSIVVGGLARNNMDSDFAVSKYTRDGVMDSTFGVNGTVTTAMGPGADVIYGTITQPDGKIVAAGMAWNGTKYDFALARYTVDGRLDSTFGDGGKKITSLSPHDNIGTALGTQDGWSIVLGGLVNNGNDNDFGVVRYTRDGQIDSTFGVNGIAITDMLGASDDEMKALAVQPDSSIVVGGTSHSSATAKHFSVARYTKDGALDNSFGTGGKVINAGTGDDEASALILQPDGKIIIGGYSTNGSDDDFGLLRLMPDGSVDNTFGGTGHVITPIGSGDEELYSLLVQPDGKIIAGGSTVAGQYENNGIVRYNADGTLDNTFGTNGKVVSVLSTHDNEIYGMKLETDGKLVTGGYANDGGNDLYSMARYLTGLTLGVLDFTKNNNSILIYPNPVPADATLEYTLAKDETVSIRIVDMQGKTVQVVTDTQQQTAGDHKQQLHLSESLAKGSYTIAISSASGQMSVRITK